MPSHGLWRRRAMRVALVEPAAGEAAEAAGESGAVQGVVVSVKGGGGFVRCCDRDARVYFAMADVDPASLPVRAPRPGGGGGGGGAERHGQEAAGSAGGKGDAETHCDGGHEEVRAGTAVGTGAWGLPSVEGLRGLERA